MEIRKYYYTKHATVTCLIGVVYIKLINIVRGISLYTWVCMGVYCLCDIEWIIQLCLLLLFICAINILLFFKILEPRLGYIFLQNVYEK